MPDQVSFETKSSSQIDSIVDYCQENRDEVNFYRVTGPIDHWITAVEKKVWGFSSESDYRGVEEGDVLLLHATNSAVNSELTSKKSGIIGVAVISGKREKDEAWWWSEHEEGDEWKYVVDLEPMLITGSPEDIDRSRGITEKSINEIEKETFALLENFMEMSRANEICNEINAKDFPAMGSRSGFRDQNGDIDTEAPIKIIKEIQANLSDVESTSNESSKTMAVSGYNANYGGKVPEEVKEQLDLMVKNAENNRGSYTRLYGVKSYFDAGKGFVTDKELKESAGENFREEFPGTRQAYIQNRHKAFQKEDYPAFQEHEEGYRLNPEYEDSRDGIESYVNQLWREATNDRNYFVISHNDREDQFADGYLQAPYTEKSEDYEGRYTPSHDLSKLSKGDKILHYMDKEFVGYSEVKKEPEIVETEGEKKFYLDVDITQFENPRALSQVREILEKEKDKVESYYVLDSQGGKAEGYLKSITQTGFEYILKGEKHSPIDVKEDISADIDLEFKDLYFPEGEAESLKSQIEASIKSGKNIIFTGPPGTGKTELAELVAKEIQDDDNVKGYQMTTATADWSTFDTVGGFMPEKDGEGELEFNSGQILKRFKDDSKSLKNELLVIDEINRSDIDKAFGQLFTVLSGQKVQLPFEAENEKEIEVIPGDHEDASNDPDENEFVIPESWRILATMNSYDKTSLYEMSYAFMRRFAFIRVDAPDEDLSKHLEEYNKHWSLDVSEDEKNSVAEIWRETNTAVDGRKIGPAIAEDMLSFLAEGEGDLKDRSTYAVINYIFPQLEGVRKNNKIVKEIAESGKVHEDQLKNVARDMLQVKFDGDK